MGIRYGAFFLAVAAGGLEIAGSVIGLGILHHGFLFGPGGLGTASTGVGFGLACALATIICGVLLMFRHETRLLAGFVALAAGLGTLAAGPAFGLAGFVALVAATLAWRVDPAAPLT